MKKRKRYSGIHIHLTNRWLYTLIALGILIVAGVGVYAAVYVNSVTKTGHDLSELAPCAEGQILKSVGGVWSCSGNCDSAGGCSQLCIGTSCKTTMVNLYKINQYCVDKNLLTTGTTCKAAVCGSYCCNSGTRGECLGYCSLYYTCSGACTATSSATCNNVLTGYFLN